jgi:hypothetical protein
VLKSFSVTLGLKHLAEIFEAVFELQFWQPLSTTLFHPCGILRWFGAYVKHNYN